MQRLGVGLGLDHFLYITPRRNFTTLDGSSWFNIPDIELDGDFKIKGKFSTTDTSQTYNMLIGGSGNNYIAVQSDGNFRYSFDSTLTVVGSTLNLNDGKIHEYEVERVGTSVTTKINDALISTDTNAGTFSIAKLGAYSNGSTFNMIGVVADYLIWKEGVLIRDYPIDEDFSTTSILVNRATTLGVEKVTNGDFATDSDWTLNGWTIGSGKINATNEELNATQDIGSTIGVQYLVQYDLVSISNGDFRAILGTGLGTVVNSVGTYTELITQAFNTIIGLDARFNFTGSIDNVSVKQADGYGTAIGSPSSELFTLVGRDWLGVEELLNPNFATNSDWSAATGFTISGGKLNINGTGGAFTYQSKVYPVGYIYKLDTLISGYVSGLLRMYQGSTSDVIIYVSANGRYTDIGVRDGNSFYIQCSTAFSGSVDYVSLKRILQAP